MCVLKLTRGFANFSTHNQNSINIIPNGKIYNSKKFVQHIYDNQVQYWKKPEYMGRSSSSST